MIKILMSYSAGVGIEALGTNGAGVSVPFSS